MYSQAAKSRQPTRQDEPSVVEKLRHLERTNKTAFLSHLSDYSQKCFASSLLCHTKFSSNFSIGY